MSADLTSNTMVPYQRAREKLVLIFAAQWDFPRVILQAGSTNLTESFLHALVSNVTTITISIDYTILCLFEGDFVSEV